MFDQLLTVAFIISTALNLVSLGGAIIVMAKARRLTKTAHAVLDAAEKVGIQMLKDKLEALDREGRLVVPTTPPSVNRRMN